MLPKKETLTIEFKSDLKKYSDSDIFEAVVSFANTEGGDLYLGIECIRTGESFLTSDIIVQKTNVVVERW